MLQDEIIQLYDDEYAASYENKFIHSHLSKSDADYEIVLLRQFLKPGVNWLDVACGTGYFLSQFPDVDRAGIDLSPSMLRLAKKANPNVTLLEHNYCDPILAWENTYGLVSCMWYAYGLVSSIHDLQKLIKNLAYWTSKNGTCFMPLLKPQLLTGVNLPYQAQSPNEGKVMITGIIWSYIEEDGRKVHAHQIAPNIDFMIEEFEKYFSQVHITVYPPAFPGWEGRPALVATEKKLF